MAYPGYKPFREPYLTKIVEVGWPTGPTGPPPPRDQVLLLFTSVGFFYWKIQGEFGTQAIIATDTEDLTARGRFAGVKGFSITTVSASGFVGGQQFFGSHTPLTPPEQDDSVVTASGPSSFEFKLFGPVHGESFTFTAQLGIIVWRPFGPSGPAFTYQPIGVENIRETSATGWAVDARYIDVTP